VADALAELACAPARTYFDADQDAQQRAAYYGDLPGELGPEELFNALHDLLDRTGTRMAKYSPSKHVYPWVDLQPNLKLKSVYSGREFEPATFIQEDFLISQERALRASELMLNEAALSPEELAEQLSLLEASLPFNCEHVVCQSWFREREPMRGDLHHLFACETGCNSFRSNIPYFDFADFEEAVRHDCGKRETERFEPGAGKGEVARATLYFLLRYPGQARLGGPVYDEERLKTLLAWHTAHPVTLHEKHRNMAIFERQGNRNPLIDFPEWSERIKFELGL
jgi:endonuclease I